jgi:hypothetical protein
MSSVTNQNVCVTYVLTSATPVGVAYYKRRAVQYYTSLQRTFDPHLGKTREWLDQYLLPNDMRLQRGWMRRAGIQWQHCTGLFDSTLVRW